MPARWFLPSCPEKKGKALPASQLSAIAFPFKMLAAEKTLLFSGLLLDDSPVISRKLFSPAATPRLV
jgi:hypothetical protein